MTAPEWKHSAPDECDLWYDGCNHCDVPGCMKGWAVEAPDGGRRCEEHAPPLCRHCGDPLGQVPSNGEWAHQFSATYFLYRCQRNVPYGHNAAHPDVPCVPGGPNPCACTYT